MPDNDLTQYLKKIMQAFNAPDAHVVTDPTKFRALRPYISVDGLFDALPEELRLKAVEHLMVNTLAPLRDKSKLSRDDLRFSNLDILAHHSQGKHSDPEYKPGQLVLAMNTVTQKKLHECLIFFEEYKTEIQAGVQATIVAIKEEAARDQAKATAQDLQGKLSGFTDAREQTGHGVTTKIDTGRSASLS